METRPIAVEGLSDRYSITNDGQLYSHIKHRFLKGAINSAGYRYFYLMGKWYFAHRLVYEVYVGKIRYEVNHLDRNKLNNHYLNLEDITHRENIRKARSLKPWKSGRISGWPQTEETKVKIGKANSSPVMLISSNGTYTELGSVGKAAEHLGVSYSTVIRALNRGVLQEFPTGLYRLKRSGK